MPGSRSTPVDPEPDFGPWRVRSPSEIVEALDVRPMSDAARHVLAIDGRSGSGKTTFAARLAERLPTATVVHVDDVSWHHSFFDWQAPLATHVLDPFRRGDAVSWRPRAWRERGREGAISVERACEWLILEGVGAGRRELSALVDALVWIASDAKIARARGIDRDGGDAEALRFWNEWMAAEVPFLDDQRPWTRADLVVCGTPAVDVGGDEAMVSDCRHANPAG